MSRADDDLAQAVTAGRRAAAATPAHHPARGSVLVNLANLVLIRFEHWRAVGDLDRAIGLGEDALRAGGIGGATLAGLLSNLGDAYRTRHEHDPRPSDLDRAVDLAHQSESGTGPADPHRASRLSNHAMSVLARYEHSGDPADLASALTSAREAIGQAGRAHPERSKFLSNLTIVLAAHAATLDGPTRLAALDEAVGFGRAALDALAPDDLDGPIRMINLAGSLMDRARYGQDPSDRRAAAGLYADAAATETAPVAIRVRAARSRGTVEASARRWPEAAAAYADAVRLLDRLAARRIGRRDREDLLSRFALLAVDASAAALNVRHASDAVALLEQGRSVLWAQALDSREGEARLRERRPDLADRLSQIAEALE